MTTSVPLGVRMYNNWGRAFDFWATQYVEDIEFRSVIPGGFASATITLHNMDEDLFSQYARLYTRVQIVDNASEIVWEGRIEQPRRLEQANAWELGCLGSMVITGDIQAPVFFIDYNTDQWNIGSHGRSFGIEKDDDAKTITIRPETQVTTTAGDTDNLGPVAFFFGAQRCGQEIGRFDITYGGDYASNVVRTSTTVGDVFANSETVAIDTTAWNSANIRKVNKITNDWSAAQESVVLVVHVDTTATGNYTGRGGFLTRPHVHALRMDIKGNELRATADYPNGYVTVDNVIRDTIGRLLVKGWNRTDPGLPFTGHADPNRSFVDGTSTKQIYNLTYYDGATAADIFNDMMLAQTDAYWAVWESNYRATNRPSNDGLFRIEWRKWSKNINLRASIVDGIEEQPDGQPVYNFIFYEWHLDPDAGTAPSGALVTIQHSWDGGNNPDAVNANLTRALTVVRESSLGVGIGDWTAGNNTINADAENIIEGAAAPHNSGTLTIGRPVHCWDPGTVAGENGVSRMLQPWEIRPGKIVQIYDMPPLSQINNVGALGSNTYPNFERGNSIYRIVATTYRSESNTCVLELDQVQSWDTATQIADLDNTKGNLILKN